MGGTSSRGDSGNVRCFNGLELGDLKERRYIWRSTHQLERMILTQFVARSRATPAFLQAVESFRGELRPNEWIHFDRESPAVKVERTITQLLAKHPELPIESVRFDAVSGCEFYKGALNVLAGGKEWRIDFHWDCRWKAREAGFTDYFGYPDQIRAAREFGHDCFRRWDITELPAPEIPTPIPG
jgi:hypothetical protein